MLEDGATLDLTLSGSNTLHSAQYKAGICVPGGATLRIHGNGSLHVTGGDGAAAIGSDRGDREGSIKTVGRIEIHEGSITAQATGGGGAGIGHAGWGASGGEVLVAGGYVNASGNGNEGSFTANQIDITGGVIVIPDKKLDSAGKNGGFILDRDSGRLYSDVMLPSDITIPENVTLKINDGQTLTMASGITLTNLGTIDNAGSIEGSDATNGLKNEGTLKNSSEINVGNLINSGSLNNGKDGTITAATVTNEEVFLNYGTLSGAVTNNGRLYNYTGGNITTGPLTNESVLFNSGTIGVEVAVTNNGTIYGTAPENISGSGKTIVDIKYLDGNGTEQKKSFTDDLEIIDTNLTELNNGWYMVPTDMTIDHRIAVKGDVHLILTDDVSLTINGGIQVSAGNSLTIYSQSIGEQMGELTAIAAKESSDAGIGGNRGETAGTITICGGSITASGGSGGSDGGNKYNSIKYGGGSGIGGGGAYKGKSAGNGGTFIVYDGKVHAVSGKGNGGASDGNGGVQGNGVYQPGGGGSGSGIGGGGGTNNTNSGNKRSSGGSGGTVTIHGGEVSVQGNIGGGAGGGGATDFRSAKSGGDGGPSGQLSIMGGFVDVSAYIGGGKGGIGGFNLGAQGASGARGGSEAFSVQDALVIAGEVVSTDKTNWNGVILNKSGKKGMVCGISSISTGFEIPEGMEVVFEEHASLTLENGIELTNRGTMDVNHQTLTNNGKIINYSIIKNWETPNGTIIPLSDIQFQFQVKKDDNTWETVNQVPYGSEVQIVVTVKERPLDGDKLLSGCNPSAEGGNLQVRIAKGDTQEEQLNGTVNKDNAALFALSLNDEKWKPGDFTIQAEFGGTSALLENTGAGTLPVTKVAQNDKPSAPSLSRQTDTMITLNAVTGSSGHGAIEYAYAQGANAAAPIYSYAWNQGKLIYENLKPDTAYTFFARFGGDSCFHPSSPSVGTVIWTQAAGPKKDVVSYIHETDTAEEAVLDFDENLYEVSDSENFPAESLISTGAKVPSGTVLYVRIKAQGEKPAGVWTQTMVPFGSGYCFPIQDSDDLVEFSNLVNAGLRNLNAELISDVDMANVNDFVSIGWTRVYNEEEGTDKGYSGIFDGKGHVIQNLTISFPVPVSGDSATLGLFGTLSGTIRNLGMENVKYYNDINEDVRLGAVCGQVISNGLMENCYVQKADLTLTKRVAGALAGANYSGRIKNCYTAECRIDAVRTGYIVSDNQNDRGMALGTIENCYTDGPSVTAGGYSGISEENESSVGKERFMSGEITWKLNGSSAKEDSVWRQNLDADKDSYPVLNDTHSSIYYGYAHAQTTPGYANHALHQEPSKDGEHSLDFYWDADQSKFFCTVCSADMGESVTLSPQGIVKIADFTITAPKSEGTVVTADSEKRISIPERCRISFSDGQSAELSEDIKYDTTNKKLCVNIQGIQAVSNLVYDGTPKAGYTGDISFSGIPGSKDDLDFTYYREETPDASSGTWVEVTGEDQAFDRGAVPVNAGRYKLVISAKADSRYAAEAALEFTVSPAQLIIKALDQTGTVGGVVPDLSAPVLGKEYTVTGLIEGEFLIEGPQLVFAAKPDMSKPGTVSIEISGAQAGDNYEIVYKNGTLTIEGNVPQDPEQDKDPGQDKDPEQDKDPGQDKGQDQDKDKGNSHSSSSDAGSSNVKTESASTGDSAAPALYLGLATLSIIGIGFLIFKRLRKKEEKH